jgi:uncharacterized membrane protein YfcA
MIIEALRGSADAATHEAHVSLAGGSIFKKCAIGAAAGILPGLLGIGTGAVLVPAFVFVLQAPVKVAIGSSLACFAANAFVSSVFKSCQGFTNWWVALPLCFGTLVGSALGALLNKRVSSALLKAVFGLIFCYVSAKFVGSFFGISV